MKNSITILTLLILFFISNKEIKASHIAGGEISYTCTSTPGVYLVTLKLYRDCSGSAIGSCIGSCSSGCSYSLNLSGVDSPFNGNTFSPFQVNLVSVQDVGTNPQCPTTKNICTNMGCVTAGTSTPGIEKYIFQGTVDLGASSGIPTLCCNVRISFSECCRDSVINTGSAGQNFYIEAIINRCMSISPCNSSPDFSNEPMAFICGGQPFVFNNGTYDVDHDSLSFAFVPALQSLGTPVTYTPPYTYDAPMPYYSAPFPMKGISCDAVTGDIMFTPTYPGSGYFVGVMAVEIRQWQYDAVTGLPFVIGITRRDIQIWLMQCPPNNPPRIMTNPPNPLNAQQPKLSWQVCAGNTLCFDVIAKDTDFFPFASPPISDTTFLTWDAALASKGATLLPKYNSPIGGMPWRRLHGPREDIYQFCWTPDSTMASTIPWQFTVTGRDSRCPNSGRSIRAIQIQVLEKAKVAIWKTDYKCGKWGLTYPKLKPSQQFSSTIWQISKVPNDYSLSSVYTYINVQTPPVLFFPAGGKYLVQLDVNTPGPAGSPPCTVQLYDTLVVDTMVQVIVSDTFVCQGSSVTIPYHGKYGRAPYSYRWFLYPDTFINPLNSPFFTGTTFTLSPNVTTRYTVQIRDMNGCRAYDSNVNVTVKVKPLPVITGVSTVHRGTADIFSVTYNSGSSYNWMISNGNINIGQGSNVINAVFNNVGTGILQVVESTTTCNSDTATKIITVTYGVGVVEHSDFEYCKIFPNPTSGILNIELTTDEKQIFIEVNDILGKVLTTSIYKHSSGDFKTAIDLSNLHPGIYFVSVKAGDRSALSRITVE
ncbi:MAG: T9SS type A sorting domain-containing protein [Bacteroidia bacterium]